MPQYPGHVPEIPAAAIFAGRQSELSGLFVIGGINLVEVQTSKGPHQRWAVVWGWPGLQRELEPADSDPKVVEGSFPAALHRLEEIVGRGDPIELPERRSLAACLPQGLEAHLVGLLDAVTLLDEGSDLLDRVKDREALVGLPGDLGQHRWLPAGLQLHGDLASPLQRADRPSGTIRTPVAGPHLCFPGLCAAAHLRGVLQIGRRAPKCAPTGRDTQRQDGARLKLSGLQTSRAQGSGQ